MILFLFWFSAFSVCKAAHIPTDPNQIRKNNNALTLEKLLKTVDETYPLWRSATQEATQVSQDQVSSLGAFDWNWKSRYTNVATGGAYDNYRLDTQIEKQTTLRGLSLFAGYRIGNGSFEVYDGKLKTNSLGEVRGGFTLPLLRNGSIDSNRLTLFKNELATEGASFFIKRNRLEIFQNATAVYWDWVATGLTLEIQDKLINNALSREFQLKERVKHGDLPRIELLENERVILQRKNSLVSAGRNFEKATVDLSLFYRDPRGYAIRPSKNELPESFPEPKDPASYSIEIDLKKAETNRPEPKQLAIQLKQNELDLNWARNQQAIRLDAQLSSSRDFGDGSGYKNTPQTEASIYLEIPLMTRNADGRFESAVVKRNRLELQESFARDRILTEVQNAHLTLNASWNRIQIARQEVKVSEKVEEAEKIRFEHGDSSLLILNLREQLTADARLREVGAQLDYFKAQAAYLAATATDSIVPSKDE